MYKNRKQNINHIYNRKFELFKYEKFMKNELDERKIYKKRQAILIKFFCEKNVEASKLWRYVYATWNIVRLYLSR